MGDVPQKSHGGVDRGAQNRPLFRFRFSLYCSAMKVRIILLVAVLFGVAPSFGGNNQSLQGRLCSIRLGELLDVKDLPAPGQGKAIEIGQRRRRDDFAARLPVVQLRIADGEPELLLSPSRSMKSPFAHEERSGTYIPTATFAYPRGTRIFPGGYISDQVYFDRDVSAFYVTVQEGDSVFVDTFQVSPNGEKMRRKARIPFGEMELFQAYTLEDWGPSYFVMLGSKGGNFSFQAAKIKLEPTDSTFKTYVGRIFTHEFPATKAKLIKIEGGIGVLSDEDNKVRIYDYEKEKILAIIEVPN